MASLKVAVRVRPFNQREIDMGAKLIVEMDSKKTRLTYNKVSGLWQSDTDRDRFKDFTFDYSYWSYDETDSNYASQEQVYSDLGTDVVDSAFEGYNACVFAYGQTGSGKTFTMMGSPDCQGLIPRICKNLFNRMRAGKEKGANYRTEVSYLEIYNERVKDLLSSGSGHSLKVREHPKQGPYVQDLSKHLVMDYTNIQECMVRGNSQRTTASTNMNDVSSRSHAIFTITFVQAGFSNDMPSETVSKVHLVDLAGSERADTSGATGQRLKEGAHINKSLVTLGSVISALAELSVIQSSRSVFIPYRDSVLTWLLKDSLGGNSKTIMIAAISPADCNYGETLSTLRYANRAKNIINKPTINEDPNVKLIRELRDEISKLKALMMSDNSVIIAEPQVLAALQEKEAQEKVLTEEWAEKWRETQQILQEQRALGLRKSGLGVVLDSDIPHLVGIDDDLLSTGVTLYHLKEGETLIGSNESPSLPDIVLSGPGVLAQHCSVVLQNGVATIHPKPPAQCWLNTVLLEKPARLSQGCILLLGRTNMFRYNDPAEAAKLRRGGNKSRLNLSRLSLLSWSTTDLAASSENLNNTNEDNEIEAQRAELLKEKQSFHREQTVREQDWAHEQQTRLEALQSAEKQLQLEREQMKQNYKVQCQKLAEDWQRLEKSQQDSLVSLLNREKQLQISKDLLKKEREEIIVQVEHESSIVANLRASLADRRKLLCELILFHIDRLKNIGVEMDIPTLQVEDYDFSTSHDLDRWLEELLKHSDNAARDTLLEHKSHLSTIEKDLHTRSSLLVEHEVHLTDIDLQLSDLNVKQNELLEFSASGDNSELLNLRQAIMCRPQSEIELIQQRKLSLSLNIKRPHSGDEMNIIEDLLMINNATQPNTSKTPIKSFETFHTANSDCSVGSNTSVTLGFDNAMIDSGVLLDLDRPISCTMSHPLMTPIDNCHVTDSDYTETKEGNKIILHSNNDKSTVITSKYDTSIPHSFLRNKITHIDTNTKADVINQSPELTPDDGRPPCNTPTENIAPKPLKAMHRLQQRISRQKMLIMRNLEGHCPKEQLDHQIAVLQEQQRQHVNLEKYFQRTLGSHDFPDPLINVLSSSPEADSSDGSVDLAVDPIEDEGSMLSPLQYSSVYLSNHPENGSPCSLSLTRSMPTFSGYDKDGHVVGVTGFLVRGAGKLTHVEYEVRVHVVDDSWCLLRRYSRFRDLHLTLKARYGTKVSVISFPPRHLFSSNSDSIARTRKRQLEVYLRRLLQVCSNIPGCPLYGCRDACTKLALLEFSDFFKKGIFESTKYGTS